MDPQIFPTSPGPLTVSSGGQSGFSTFTESVGPTNTMFIRVQTVGTECEPPGAARPIVQLRVGLGLPVGVPEFPQRQPVFDAVGSPVAEATIRSQTDDMQLVEIQVNEPGNDWRMQLINDDSVERHLIWVVASTDNGTKQPWIQLPADKSFGELAHGTSTTQTVQVRNIGTGTLTFDTVPGPIGNIGHFTLIESSGPVQPNRCGAFKIRFTAPNAAGTSATVGFAPHNNDPVTTHSRSVELSGRSMTAAPTPQACTKCTKCTGFKGDLEFFPDKSCLDPACKHLGFAHNF